MERDTMTLFIDHFYVIVIVCLVIGYQVGAFMNTLDKRQKEREERYWAKRRSMRNHPTHKGRIQ
jgi:hypothetical protein